MIAPKGNAPERMRQDRLLAHAFGIVTGVTMVTFGPHTPDMVAGRLDHAVDCARAKEGAGMTVKHDRELLKERAAAFDRAPL